MSKTEAKHQEFMAKDDSYEEIYEQENNQLSDPYEAELMLDENEQFEMYQHVPRNQESSEQHEQSQLKIQQQIENQNHSGPIKSESHPEFVSLQQKSIKHEAQQGDTDFEQEIQQIQHILQTKYAHFDKSILLKMLYDKCFPEQQVQPEPFQKTSESLKNDTSNSENIKAEDIEGINERKDLDYIKKINRTVKIYVQHGYGINIARKFAPKGQVILPNPYNNMICKIIRETWKNIESQMAKIRRSIKPLNSDQFNQVRTPLVNSRAWMKKQYLEIFLGIISYVYTLRPEKPSFKQYERFYDYLIPKAKGKKFIDKKDASNKKKFKESNSRFNESSEQFTVPKHKIKSIMQNQRATQFAKKNKY